jgi:hypothetical protein
MNSLAHLETGDMLNSEDTLSLTMNQLFVEEIVDIRARFDRFLIENSQARLSAEAVLTLWEQLRGAHTVVFGRTEIAILRSMEIRAYENRWSVIMDMTPDERLDFWLQSGQRIGDRIGVMNAFVERDSFCIEYAEELDEIYQACVRMRISSYRCDYYANRLAFLRRLAHSALCGCQHCPKEPTSVFEVSSQIYAFQRTVLQHKFGNFLLSFAQIVVSAFIVAGTFIEELFENYASIRVQNFIVLLIRSLGHVLHFIGARSPVLAIVPLWRTVVPCDGNRALNIGRLISFYSSDRIGILKLHGYTMIGEVSLPFPVYCDPQTTVRVFALIRALPARDRRKLFLHSEFTVASKDVCRPLFAPILNSRMVMSPQFDRWDYTSLIVFFLVISIKQSYDNSSFLYDTFSILCSLLYFMLPPLAQIDMSELAPHRVAYVMLEETFNGLFGIAPIIALEAYLKRPRDAVVTTLVHLVVHMFPFPVRIFLHWIWNNAAMRSPQYYAAVDFTLDNVAYLSFLVDMVRKLLAKDGHGFILSLGMAPGFKNQFLNLLGITDVELLSMVMEDPISRPDVVTADGEELHYLVDDRPRLSFLFEWLPASVRKSPTFARVIALVVMLTSCSFFTSMEPVKKIVGLCDWERVFDVGDLFSTVAAAFKAVVEGFQRFTETGDWRTFFDPPRDVAFLIDGHKVLSDVRNKDSLEEVNRKIAHARELVDRRTYCTNSVEISRMLDKLRAYLASKEKFIRDQACRQPPLTIWENGEPGVGKTAIMSFLKDYLVQLINRERFPGDTLIYDHRQKYPVLPSSNEEAIFLDANDIAALHTESSKQDLLPFDVALQQINDTFPLSFRQAAIEDKGKIFNNIKFMFITSNHYSFRFEGETEKLQRRLQNNVNVDVIVVDKKGKELKYEEFSKMSQGERNDAWRFIVMNVACEDKFIKFTRSQVSYNLAGFMEYVRVAVKSHEAACEAIKNNFQEGALRCSCGMPVTIHEGSVRPSDSLQILNDDKGGVFRALTPQCWKPNSEEIPTKFSYFVAYDKVENLGTLSFDAISVVALVITCVLGFICGDIVFGYLKFVTYRRLDLIASEMEMKFYLSDRAHDFLRSVSEQPRWRLTYWAFLAKRTFMRMKRFAQEYARYIALVGMATLAATFYKYGRKDDLLAKPIYASQVDAESMNVVNYRREMNFPLETRRDWGKPEGSVDRVDLQSVNVGEFDLLSMVRKQTEKVTIVFSSLQLQVDALGFFISPEWVLFNQHYFLKDKNWYSNEFTITFRNNKYPFKVGALKRVPGTEVFALKHHFPCLFRGLHKFLPMKNVQTVLDVVIAYPFSDPKRIVAAPNSYVGRDGTIFQSLQWHGAEEKGACMTPVLGRVDGTSFIVGFIGYKKEPAFSKPMSGCTLVSKEWFDALNSDVYPVVEDVLLVNEFGPTEELSLKSELRNVPSAYFQVVGTMPGGSNTFKTDFRRSRMFGEFHDKLSKEFGVPMKTKVVVDGTYMSAFTNSHKNLELGCDISENEIEKVVQVMLDDCFPQTLIDEKKIKLSPITFEEAIFGCPELGIDRIDFKTSAGPILKKLGMKNKYDFFEEVEFESYKFSQEVKERVLWLDSNFRQGISVAVLVDQVLKDEIRSMDKLLKAKIRIFCVLDAALNVYGRMMLMPIICFCLQYRELSECYGAMNAGSLQWNDLATRLNKSGFFNFDMDFETFDISHGSKSFTIFAKLFFLAALRLGYEPLQAAIVYAFLISLKWQLAKYVMDLYLKFKGMPSGVIVTLIFNSLINSSLMRIAYERLVEDMKNFRNNVVPATVGDDNASSANRVIFDRYNMVTIAPEYLKMGYKVTMGKKDNDLVREVAFEDLTFLKRRFDWSDEMGAFLAPLETDSIYKALCFERRESGVSPPERLAGIADGAQREAFLHGKEFFAKFQRELVDAFDKHQIPLKVHNYEALKGEFLENKFRTFAC